MLSVAAGLALAVFIAAPGFAAPDVQTKSQTAAKKSVVQGAKPTWEQCYAMSRQRGFDHEIEEWHQSIQDCMAGKIPL